METKQLVFLANFTFLHYMFCKNSNKKNDWNSNKKNGRQSN